MTDNKDRPVLPDAWVEFDYSDPDPDAVNEEVGRLSQGWHKLHKPVDSGVDEERGPFDVIPLAMLRGAEAKPKPVYKKPMKHMVLDQSIPPRGWYKSKIESDRVRPRPCYSEALLTSPYLGYCPIGCVNGELAVGVWADLECFHSEFHWQSSGAIEDRQAFFHKCRSQAFGDVIRVFQFMEGFRE